MPKRKTRTRKMNEQTIDPMEVWLFGTEEERLATGFGPKPKMLTGKYFILDDEVNPEEQGQYNPTGEPRYTWQEIYAMSKKCSSKNLQLYVEDWLGEDPLPIMRNTPPDWQAIEDKLDKGPAQDLEPLIQGYLD